jgi:hypothetical protein
MAQIEPTAADRKGVETTAAVFVWSPEFVGEPHVGRAR